MKNISKFFILLGLFLQIGGHPVKYEVVGWDYCTEEGHAFYYNGYRFCWPVPAILVDQIWGCLSTPNQWIGFDGWALIYDAIFWVLFIGILERWWPVEK